MIAHYAGSAYFAFMQIILDSVSQISIVTSKVFEILGITLKRDDTNIVGIGVSSNAAYLFLMGC